MFVEPSAPPKLLDRVRQSIRLKHYPQYGSLKKSASFFNEIGRWPLKKMTMWNGFGLELMPNMTIYCENF